MASAAQPGADLAGAAREATHYGTGGAMMPQLSDRRSTQRTPRDEESACSSESQLEDPDIHEYQEIEETTYSGTMATIIKDLYFLFRNPPSKHKGSRTMRIAFAIFISMLLVVCQVYVLVTIKTFVTSPAVRSIRNVYDEYQRTMYHNHVHDSGYGFSLGDGGPSGKYFDPTQFDKLSDDMKGSVCLIPFSQSGYLSIILLVWMLSVIGELRHCSFLAQWLWHIKKVDTLEEMVDRERGGEHDLVVVGLPLGMKFLISMIVLVPRTVITLILAWLGCRWLTATLDFTEVLINAIALEFVIKLNELIYMQLISDRSKRDNRGLKMDMGHHDGHRAPSTWSFIGTMGWGIGAVTWIYVYIHFLQLVIPGYQWDVRGPCTPWVQERFNFWRI